MSDILNITDGTTTLNLYNLADGYSVDGWRQAIAQYKAGGIFQDSSIATGRRLALRRHANALETIPINVSGATSDIAAAALRDLTVLLEKAADYWEHDWQNDPVWLEAKDDCETETRYSLIVTGQIPDIPDQHSLARTFDSVVYDGLSLVVERQHWTENKPGTGTAVALSMIQTYDGRTLGNVDSTGTREPTTNDDQVYMANKHNIAQLTDIYHYDALPVVTWSGNLLDVGPPTTLLPAVPLVNDFIVFGIDTAVANSGPFNSLVFDLSQAQANLTMQWEFYNGAGWTNMTGSFMQDNTDTAGLDLGDPFDTLGRGTVHWQQVSTWQTGNLLTIFGGAAPNITGWWIRCLVTATPPGGEVPPIQQNRDIYTITWGCTEVLADVTTGDLSSLAEWRFLCTSTLSYGLMKIERMILGLRSYDRGANFQSYLNFGDTQLITGQTNLILSGATANDATDITGRNFVYTPAAAATVDVYEMELSQTVSDGFYGMFRIFMRVDMTVSANPHEAQLTYQIGDDQQIYAQSDWVTLDQSVDYYVPYDFGTVHIPGANISTPTDWRITVTVRSPGAPYPTYTFRDIILIPADEWIIDTIMPGADNWLTIRREFSIDSISWPKNWLTATTELTGLGRLGELWSARTGDVSQLVKRGERQRLWGLYSYDSDSAEPMLVTWMQCFKNDRYLSPRGSS